MLSTRQHIEQAILGQCLLERGYIQVADVLSPVNFSEGPYNHRLIYQAMQNNYPTKPVDFISLLPSLPTEYAAYLAGLMSRVCSTTPIRYHACVLIELSIRESFIELLNNLHQKVNVELVRLALYEIQDETLNYDNDIFELVQKSIEYIKPFNEPYATNALTDFALKIDKRINTIKHQASIDCLLDNLLHLNHCAHDVNTKLAVTHLAEQVKIILSQGTITNETLTRILSITA